jgi:uncharacterized protein
VFVGRRQGTFIAPATSDRICKENSMTTQTHRFAIVTGASTGIGLELAKRCAAEGFDLLIAADEAAIHDVAATLSASGVSVEAVQADLSTLDGVNELLDAANDRPIDALFANAGRGLGGAFLDQDFEQVVRVINTNVTGTLYLIQKVANRQRARGEGRILVTGSIAGFMPGTFQAVYNGTKAFVDSFAAALRAELRDSGVTVTCLMPGPTETEFFKRANLMDTKVGVDKKQPADDVARIGFEAMMRGDADIVAGLKNKLQAAAAHVMPSGVLAEQHRKMAEPGSAKR